MHIADGYLANTVCTTTTVISLGFLLFSWKNAQKEEWTSSQVWATLMVFALQMLNFPISTGSSGHFFGGAFLLLFASPWRATQLLSLVLIIQAFVFSDGGIFSLGANILVMALSGIWSAYGIRKILPKNHFSLGLASFVSILAATFVCTFLLYFSGTNSFLSLFKAMFSVHLFIAVGEGILTIAAYQYAQTFQNQKILKNLMPWILASFIALLAASTPDGLETVASQLGFLEKSYMIWESPFADYEISSIPYLSTSLAGILGLFCLKIIFQMISRTKKISEPSLS